MISLTCFTMINLTALLFDSLQQYFGFVDNPSPQNTLLPPFTLNQSIEVRVGTRTYSDFFVSCSRALQQDRSLPKLQH